MTADLLAALERLVDVLTPMMAHRNLADLTPLGFAAVEERREEARAAIAAHKDAHRDGADAACPCYREGWQAGHEERT